MEDYECSCFIDFLKLYFSYLSVFFLKFCRGFLYVFFFFLSSQKKILLSSFFSFNQTFLYVDFPRTHFLGTSIKSHGTASLTAASQDAGLARRQLTHVNSKESTRFAHQR